jgi:hypothetical protein
VSANSDSCILFSILFSELGRSPQKSVTPNLRAQSATALHGLFRSGCECGIHPVAGTTFFSPEKADALKLKLHSDQFVQTNATSDCIATKNFRAAVPNTKLPAKMLIRFFLKKSDLTLVPLFVAKVPVPGDSFSGDAFDFVQFDRGVVSGRSAVVANEVVTNRDKQMEQFKIDGNHGQSIVSVNLHVKGGRKEGVAGVTGGFA